MGNHIVIADTVSFRDPEDKDRGPLRREDQHHLYVDRGEELPDGVSEGEIARLLKQHAIAEPDSDHAKRAVQGLPRSTTGGPAGIPLPDLTAPTTERDFDPNAGNAANEGETAGKGETTATKTEKRVRGASPRKPKAEVAAKPAAADVPVDTGDKS